MTEEETRGHRLRNTLDSRRLGLVRSSLYPNPSRTHWLSHKCSAQQYGGDLANGSYYNIHLPKNKDAVGQTLPADRLFIRNRVAQIGCITRWDDANEYLQVKRLWYC